MKYFLYTTEARHTYREKRMKWEPEIILDVSTDTLWVPSSDMVPGRGNHRGREDHLEEVALAEDTDLEVDLHSPVEEVGRRVAVEHTGAGHNFPEEGHHIHLEVVVLHNRPAEGAVLHIHPAGEHHTVVGDHRSLQQVGSASRPWYHNWHRWRPKEA